ncbi:MAG: ComF family protein [Saccharofermentanales bacterium]
MVRKAMLEMKFYESAYHKEAFGSMMALMLGMTRKSFDCIIPIPLHEKRLKERGYNQSLLIAEKLSSITGIPVIHDCLTRNQYTGRQSETKNRAQRIDNLTGAFCCARPDLIKGKKILILDDVLTSGATIFNAARSLRSAASHMDVKDATTPEKLDITGITLASER